MKSAISYPDLLESYINLNHFKPKKTETLVLYVTPSLDQQ